MRDAPSNTDDVIDSRDVIARIEELESELQDAHEGESDPPALLFQDWVHRAAGNDAHTLQDAAVEYRALKALADQGEGYGDWRRGETLIAEAYFTEYAQQLADDIGAINKDATWPSCHIDWEAAAASLKKDYTEVDFGGAAFLMRA